jgi:cysteine desulfurase family protein (TIGR01976 family)
LAVEEATTQSYDARRVRHLFPALADGYAYLDGAAGTQVPEPVIQAIGNAYRRGLSNTDGAFPSSVRANEIVTECRRAVADLVGGVPEGVVLGPNMTTLTYRLAFSLAKSWESGDEIVVSRLDHDANVRPWIQAAARAGATVRWAEIDTDTCELPVEQYRSLVGPRTKLVAFTAASNVLGTRPEVAEISAIVHAAGALTYVDGVHATPHGPVDVRSWGADFYTTSSYKWCGPHIGAVVADPQLLERIDPDKLTPAPDEVPDRFQTGTPPFADYAGVTAAVEHLSRLVPEGQGTRRERVVRSMTAVDAYEGRLFSVLLGGLDEMDHVTLYGQARRRAPTAYFTVRGMSPWAVAQKLADRKINVWSGDNYAWEVTGALGIRATGCAVRAGLVHYNDHTDVARLLEAVDALKR